MLGSLAYLGLCFLAAALLTLAWALTRPIRDKGESRPWRVLLALWVIMAAAPYGWAEVMTKLYGEQMQETVEAVLAELKVNRGLKFYRVLTCDGKTARVVAVGEEDVAWGSTERPVIAMTLEKKGRDWEAIAWNVVSSVDRNEDSTSLPPYW
jgi:hypothetical protein